MTNLDRPPADQISAATGTQGGRSSTPSDSQRGKNGLERLKRFMRRPKRVVRFGRAIQPDSWSNHVTDRRFGKTTYLAGEGIASESRPGSVLVGSAPAKDSTNETIQPYAVGLCSASACAPKEASAADVERAVNRSHPTGVGPWTVADEAFRDGSSNPCPCNTDPSRRHWLLHC